MQFEGGPCILRVIHGRDAGATWLNCTTANEEYSLDSIRENHYLLCAFQISLGRIK